MSKRWVSKEDFDDLTSAATDPGRIVHRFIPQLRAHVITKYAWMDDRGNCLLAAEDLIQLASIRLMSLADRWERIVLDHPEWARGNDGTYDAIFFNYLKTEVKTVLFKARDKERRATYEGLTFEIEGEELERPSLYEGSGADIHDRTGIRRRPDGPWWSAVFNEIMTFWDQMPQKEKIVLALRYYDELIPEQVCELVGTSRDCEHRAVQKWRAHTRNMVKLGDDREPVARTNSRTHAWQPSELLETYLTDRHGNTLPEYLGIVTIGFRADPELVIRILDTKTFYTPGSRDLISLEQLDVIDRMAAEGHSYRQIAVVAGISSNAVGLRLDPARRDRLRNRNRSRSAA